MIILLILTIIVVNFVIISDIWEELKEFRGK